MANIFHEDFSDFIKALNNCQVEYILVGGYSVILHGYSRTTGDLDIWVNTTKDNYKKLAAAFYEFGMSLFDMSEDNFLNNRQIDVFTFGRPPVSIDIMKEVKGLEFDEAYKNSNLVEIESISIRLVDYRDLLKAKKATSRSKDINDIENLDEK
jgi:hypothetical protein